MNTSRQAAGGTELREAGLSVRAIVRAARRQNLSRIGEHDKSRSRNDKPEIGSHPYLDALHQLCPFKPVEFVDRLVKTKRSFDCRSGGDEEQHDCISVSVFEKPSLSVPTLAGGDSLVPVRDR